MSDEGKNSSSSGSSTIGRMVPSELRLSQKWDFTVENFITKTSIGLAIGGVASLVLFRK